MSTIRYGLNVISCESEALLRKLTGIQSQFNSGVFRLLDLTYTGSIVSFSNFYDISVYNRWLALCIVMKFFLKTCSLKETEEIRYFISHYEH